MKGLGLFRGKDSSLSVRHYASNFVDNRLRYRDAELLRVELCKEDSTSLWCFNLPFGKG